MLTPQTPSLVDVDVQKIRKKGTSTEALTLYLAFCALCSLVWQSFQGIGLSTLPTLSVGLQVLALVFLRIKITKTQNVCGISAKALQMQAAVHGLRLCSTAWLKGYIPSDGTGDWFYQLMDSSALVMCLTLLYTVLKTHRSTYQQDCDTFDVKPAFLMCILLAILIHPDLDDRVCFDAIWTASLYADVVSMMPQLWLMSKVGGNVEALTGHYVASITCARIVEFAFWYFGFAELAPVNGGPNVAGWAIVIAQLMQLLLLADFMYYYVKAWMVSCCACSEGGACCSAPVSMPVNNDPIEV